MYSHDRFSLEVWVDYKDSNKGEGRVIYKSEIKKWLESPSDAAETVSDIQKDVIVACIVRFLADGGVKDVLIG